MNHQKIKFSNEVTDTQKVKLIDMLNISVSMGVTSGRIEDIKHKLARSLCVEVSNFIEFENEELRMNDLDGSIAITAKLSLPLVHSWHMNAVESDLKRTRQSLEETVNMLDHSLREYKALEKLCESLTKVLTELSKPWYVQLYNYLMDRV